MADVTLFVKRKNMIQNDNLHGIFMCLFVKYHLWVRLLIYVAGVKLKIY